MNLDLFTETSEINMSEINLDTQFSHLLYIFFLGNPGCSREIFQRG